MIIKTKWNEDFKFEAENELGRQVFMDAHENIGGGDTQQSPMEILLSALAGCMGINVIKILRRYQDQMTRFEMEVDADRSDDQARPYTAYYINFIFEGDLPEQQVRRAVDLSHEKYCSVSKSLKGDFHATITLNGKSI